MLKPLINLQVTQKIIINSLLYSDIHVKLETSTYVCFIQKTSLYVLLSSAPRLCKTPTRVFLPPIFSPYYFCLSCSLLCRSRSPFCLFVSQLFLASKPSKLNVAGCVARVSSVFRIQLSFSMVEKNIVILCVILPVPNIQRSSVAS